MITDLFEKAGYNVISNRKGDNLKAGIVTTLLTHAKLNGEIKANAVVLECDELNVRHILPFIPVTDFVVNNFFRDQLDRAREMEQLIDSIEKVLPAYRGRLILNANDPNVVRLNLVAKNASFSYFGMDENKYSVKTTKEASEGKFCPKCGARLEYSYYQYSHIGKFHCSKCDFQTPEMDICLKDIDLDKETFSSDGIHYKSPYEGMYSMYNCAVVLNVAKIMVFHKIVLSLYLVMRLSLREEMKHSHQRNRLVF